MLKRILPLLLAAVALAGFTSCDDEDSPYSSPLVGEWVLDSAYPDTFVFYDNGTGEYYGVNDLGIPDVWAIDWQSYSGSQLSIYFLQSGDQWDYYYRFQSGYLVLTDVYSGEELWYYRP